MRDLLFLHGGVEAAVVFDQEIILATVDQQFRQVLGSCGALRERGEVTLTAPRRLDSR